ncbi:pilus assembly protein TadG-related protein [Aeromicrobium sp. CTD01-1L150]|uniref:pilus assembly protein TadG-related protein n=1 Tax=Aeromicrobium sp. CTD01-1L150 TaxID=3341830 RepID=UPI0035C24869
MRRRAEKGAAAFWVIGLALVTLTTAGLVIDGGQAMTAKREAARTAEQAARVGADQLDTDSLRVGGSQLSAERAGAAARSYVSSAGLRGSVRVNGEEVTVTVTKVQPATLMKAFGRGSFTMTSTATARSLDGPEEN